MDLREQLKNLFPEHQETVEASNNAINKNEFEITNDVLVCKFEKRHGKATTIIDGYDASPDDFKLLAKSIKEKFSVGGSIKNGSIILQGNYRDQIMNYLNQIGFKTKRVGG